MKKQTHFIEGFPAFFEGGAASPLSSVRHGSRIEAIARTAPSTFSRQREKGHRKKARAKSPKRTHLMPDFLGLSVLIPLPLQGKGLGVRSPHSQIAARSFFCRRSLRSLGAPAASAQDDRIEAGKGLRVRSAIIIKG